MGIFGAMTTAVSGLKAQSYAMENISGNIANSRTTGYKRVDTSFVDLIPDAPARREFAGSVTAFSQGTNTVQGDLSTTGIGTHIAINGEGYFTVQARTGVADGVPTFNGSDVFTRRGDFQTDASGFLVNGSGYFLKGIPLDPVTQNLVGAQSSIVRITGDNLPARATTELEYRANFPPEPAIKDYNTGTPGSHLMVPGPAAYPGGAVPATAETQLIDSTINGGVVSVYSASGERIDVQMRLGKVTDTPPAWQAYYLSNSSATGATTRWTEVPGQFVFEDTGVNRGYLLSGPTPGTVFTVNGASSEPITIDTGGLRGITQFATGNVSEGGNAKINSIRQDGYASGELTSIAIGEGGRIQGNYNNGQVVGLYQLPIAQFSNDNGLKRGDGGVFEATLESGPPVIEDVGRAIIGGSLESSNTDIADEFSKMIVTQQAYSANTKVISTSSDMLRDIINIIR